MTYHIVAAVPGRPPAAATLTKEHSSSSYGQPVVVLDSTAYGVAEVLWIDGSKRTRAVAERAGYKVLSDEDSSWNATSGALAAERGSRGGKILAKKMGPRARKDRARRAARKRWQKKGGRDAR
jgi:hypothetical protein